MVWKIQCTLISWAGRGILSKVLVCNFAGEYSLKAHIINIVSRGDRTSGQEKRLALTKAILVDTSFNFEKISCQL